MLTRLITSRRGELLEVIGRMGTRMGLGAFEEEDVFQDTVVVCLRGLRTLRADTEKGVRSWFLGIAHNLLLHRLRWLANHRMSSIVREEEASPPRAAPPSQARESHFTQGQVSRALWHRRPDKRSAILLRELFQLSWADVATVLACPSSGAARSLHNRARY